MISILEIPVEEHSSHQNPEKLEFLSRSETLLIKKRVFVKSKLFEIVSKESFSAYQKWVFPFLNLHTGKQLRVSKINNAGIFWTIHITERIKIQNKLYYML